MLHEDRDSALFAPRRYNRNEDGQILLAGNGRKDTMNTYPYAQTGHREPYANPLLATIEASEDLLTALDNASKRLERAIAAAAIAKAAAQDAKDVLSMHEAEHVVEWTVLAEAGEGPLAGIAKTSKAYQYALDNALAAARRNGLKQAAVSAQEATVTAMNAEIELQQAQVAFRACLAAAELRTAILNGRTKSAY